MAPSTLCKSLVSKYLNFLDLCLWFYQTVNFIRAKKRLVFRSRGTVPVTQGALSTGQVLLLPRLHEYFEKPTSCLQSLRGTEQVCCVLLLEKIFYTNNPVSQKAGFVAIWNTPPQWPLLIQGRLCAASHQARIASCI